MLWLLVIQLLLFLTFSLPTTTSAAGGAPPMYSNCPNTPGGTYAPNSTYGSNLATLAAALIENATAYGSAAGWAGVAPPDVVYGVALCRGDSMGPICTERLTDAFNAAMNKSDTPICELHRNVTLYYDRHQLRFSDVDFLSGYSNEPEWVENNTNFVGTSVAAAFQGRVAGLLRTLTDAAASRPGRYAAGEAWSMEIDRPVYGLVQCTRDMTTQLCNSCLGGVLSEMPRRMNTSMEGGRIIGVRCVVRYELDAFFDIDNMTLHLDMPNGTHALFPSLECRAADRYLLSTFME